MKPRRQKRIALLLAAVVLLLFAYTRLQNAGLSEEAALPAAETETATGDTPVPFTEEAKADESNQPEADGSTSEKRLYFNENMARRRLQSEVALVYALDTGEILYEKNADLPSYPASLTKIMTQLVAIEMTDAARLLEPLAISDETYEKMVDEGAAMSGFPPGEPFTLQDMLYANFLGSAGDASETLAVALAGSLDAFVEAMNEKAAALDMNDTHFRNVTGLHAEGHVTTAHDLLKLTLAAFENPAFLDFFTADSYEASPADESSESYSIVPRLWRSLENREVPFTLIGGKTAFTEEAGLGLLTVMEKDGAHFLMITMGAPYEASFTASLDDHLWLMRGVSVID